MMPVTHFAQPLWLLAGVLVVPLVLLLYWRFDRLQRRRLLAFSQPRDTDAALFVLSRPLQWLKRLLFCVAVAAACVALARPLGSAQLQDSERRGLDILFAVDTSRSMLTPDVKPNRLTRAKLAVEGLLEHLQGDGVGLVAFAGEAFLQAPVTDDYDAFRESLDALDTHTIALGGTDIAAAIRLSEATLTLRGDAQKIVVLITDGEDLAGDGLLAAQAAAKKGVIIFTVGVGTASGELIPIPDPAGGTQFVKDPAGNFVKSHLDSDTLTRIAAATGGVYTPLGPQDQAVVQLYDQKLKGFAQREHSDRQVAVYAELFQWPLGAAVGLLVLEWLLGVSVRRRIPVAAPAGAAMVVAAVVCLALPAARAWASPQSAQDAYNKGQYALAQRDYAQSLKANPDQAHLRFNLGAAAYKAGDYAAAVAAFGDALKTREIPLQQSAYYNLGNALFRQGEQATSKDPQATVHTWQQAIGAYDTALQIQPGDADAKFNRNVVKTRLEQLQQQQKQNEQNKQQNQPNQSEQQNKQQQQGQQGQQNQPNQHGQQDPQSQHSQNNPQGQPNPGGQQRPADQPGQPQQQGPQPPAGQTRPDAAPQAGQRPQPGSAMAAQDIGRPDQMSRLEAEQLLDSTKGEERHLAIGPRTGKAENAAGGPVKDW